MLFCSFNVWISYTFHFMPSPHMGILQTHKWPAPSWLDSSVGYSAAPVSQRSWVPIPSKPEFYFRLYFLNCLSWVHNYNDLIICLNSSVVVVTSRKFRHLERVRELGWWKGRPFLLGTPSIPWVGSVPLAFQWLQFLSWFSLEVPSYNQTGCSFDGNLANFRCNIGILIDSLSLASWNLWE